MWRNEHVLPFGLFSSRMFSMILDKLFVPDTQKIDGKGERRIAAVGLTKLLCEGKQLKDGQYVNQWWVHVMINLSLFDPSWSFGDSRHEYTGIRRSIRYSMNSFHHWHPTEKDLVFLETFPLRSDVTESDEETSHHTVGITRYLVEYIQPVWTM